ncbi:odorant receptor 13a-like isoform X2 [Odontomachus brunneus]|uniref:odorant receptor 13a-like isoform X2 n=1 Tax=Odontomachus brunneus TaxID=486640 RepID=UPI0013F1D5EE|nr:odorant receptor 13a-like isoform X2 [Odontomachus brunneus]
MEFSWDRYHGFTKRLSSLVGQWPYQNKKEKLLRMSITTTAVLVMHVPQVCKFFNCNKDLNCIFGTVPVYILVLVIILKLYMGNLRSNKIKALTDRVFIDWKRLRNQQEYEIMMTYVASARWIVRFYFTICLITCIIFVSVALIPHILDVILPLNESRPIVLPYEAYYFVDERKYFFYIFLQGVITIHICLMVLLAYDTMFMTFVEHVCGIFAVAGFRFGSLVRKDIDDVKIVNNDLGDTYNKRMACCVNAHWAALEFAEHLENTFSLNIGIELLVVTIGISITLFQVTLRSGDTVEAVRYVLYVLAQMVHLFIFCWEGQRLIDHSLLMRDKIYSCTWYKKSAKSQRLILDVLQRSLRPKFLSAGKVFIFSLQGFTTVTLQSDDSLEALRYLIYVIIQFVHMFVFCWEGQRLIDHSLLIHDKIYSCSWYKKPAKSQRLIMHVLKRSLQPKFLSGGRMFIFSLQGFTTRPTDRL